MSILNLKSILKIILKEYLRLVIAQENVNALKFYYSHIKVNRVSL